MHPRRKNVVLLSRHYYDSRRRAGFHHLAQAFARLGHDVSFLTVGVSPLTFLGPAHHLDGLRFRSLLRTMPAADLNVTSFVWFTPWHPAHTRHSAVASLVDLLNPAYARLPLFGASRIISDADLVVVESSPALLLLPRLRRLARHAGFVYRQSDDPAAVGAHPSIKFAEQQYASAFDVISVPDASRVSTLPKHPHIEVHAHGVDTDLFDAPGPSPYRGSGQNAVFVGMEGLNFTVLGALAEKSPDWRFHVIGPWSPPEWWGHRDNVVFYGVLPFKTTVPYIVHADVGLHFAPHETRTVTLKVAQYTYAQLPIVTDLRPASSMEHVYWYDREVPASAVRALRCAAAHPRDAIDRTWVHDWSSLATTLLEACTPDS